MGKRRRKSEEDPERVHAERVKEILEDGDDYCYDCEGQRKHPSGLDCGGCEGTGKDERVVVLIAEVKRLREAESKAASMAADSVMRSIIADSVTRTFRSVDHMNGSSDTVRRAAIIASEMGSETARAYLTQRQARRLGGDRHPGPDAPAASECLHCGATETSLRGCRRCGSTFCAHPCLLRHRPDCPRHGG